MAKMFVLLVILTIFGVTLQEQNSKLKANYGGRIIGGNDAAAGQFPFVASINVQTSDSTFFCGGALISHQHVLTAGHCVDGATLFTVRLGLSNLSEEGDNVLTVATSDYDLHPDYNSQTLENDIGIVHLRMSIRFTDYVRSIYLPYRALADGQAVTALGWGQISDSEPDYSDRLQFVNMYTMDREFCEVYYGEGVIVETMVCVYGFYNEGICIGDSGGPLVQYSNTTSSAWHVGIASFLSVDGCESSDPSGFTRTWPYIDWITEMINS